jgi:NAD-dependent DNA ligase
MTFRSGALGAGPRVMGNSTTKRLGDPIATSAPRFCPVCAQAIRGRLNPRRVYCSLRCRYAYHALGAIAPRPPAAPCGLVER